MKTKHSRSNIAFRFAIRAIVIVGFLGPASANIISVNFYESAQTGNTLTPGETAGFEPASNWNNFTSDNSQSPKSLPNLVDKDGNPTVASVSVDGQAAWEVGLGIITSADEKLQNGYWDVGGGDGTITLSNIPYANYYAIVYLHGTNTMGDNTAAEFGARIGTEEYWLRWLKNAPNSTFTQSTTLDEATAQSSPQDDNMLRFDNNGLNYSGSSLTLDVFRDPDSTATWARAAVSGIQIVAVPEATSSSLIILGLISITGLRKFRRR